MYQLREIKIKLAETANFSERERRKHQQNTQKAQVTTGNKVKWLVVFESDDDKKFPRFVILNF